MCGRAAKRGIAVVISVLAAVLAGCSPQPAGAPPDIRGEGVVGEPLTATAGSWHFDVNRIEYRWRSCERSTPRQCRRVGADAATYVPTVADLGREIDVVVIASNPAGSSSQASARVGPVTGRPVAGIHIDGDAPGTTQDDVVLDLFAWGGPAPDEMRIANGADPTAAPWQPYQPSSAWTLDPSSGPTAVVSAQFRTGAAVSAVATDDIRVVRDGGPVVTNVPIDLRFADGPSSVDVVASGADDVAITVIQPDGSSATHPMTPTAAVAASGTSALFSWPIPPTQTSSFEFTVVAAAAAGSFEAPDEGRYAAVRADDLSSDNRTVTIRTVKLPGTGLETVDEVTGVVSPSTGEYALSTKVRYLGPVRILRDAAGTRTMHDLKRNVYVEAGADAIDPADRLGVGAVLRGEVGPFDAYSIDRIVQVAAWPGLVTYEATGRENDGSATSDPVTIRLAFDRSGTLVSSDATIGEAGQRREHYSMQRTGAGVGLTTPPVTPLSVDEYSDFLDSLLPVVAGVRSSGDVEQIAPSNASACNLGPLANLIGGLTLVAFVMAASVSIVPALTVIGFTVATVSIGLAIGAVRTWAARQFADAVNSFKSCFKPIISAIHGDPHLLTYDDLGYDLQAAGEFVHTRSTDDGFEVQIRTEFFGGRPKAVSVVDRVAVRTPAGQVVEYGESAAWLDGALLPGAAVEPLVGGGTATAGGVTLPDGTEVRVEIDAAPMYVTVTLPPARGGAIEGLLGDADGDPDDDLVGRDGGIVDWADLGGPDGYSTTYDDFAPTWLVDAGDRLFSTAPRAYEPPNPGDPFAALDDETIAAARATCEALGWTMANGLSNCVYDVALTGDPAFADPRPQNPGWGFVDRAGNVPTLEPGGWADVWTLTDDDLGVVVGTPIDVSCPPGGAPHAVWGSNTYSGGSSVCTAAAHVGLISFAAGGTVRVVGLGAQSEFVGSTFNGVTTASYSAWPVSFGFPDSTPLPVDVASIDWSRTADHYDGGDTNVFTRTCVPNGGPARIWGTGTYTGDSRICVAAVHAGLITFEFGGSVTFELTGPQESFSGSTANGVTSESWTSWPTSFRFI